MADKVVSNTNDERLEQLKRQAEAAMRRSAPPLAKRQRVEDDSADVTAGEAEKPSRYSYAAVDALFKGSTCFLATCTFKREKSATHELCDLLNTVRPGLKLQLVRVDCSGLVVITASQGGAEEDQKAAESDAQQQQQQEQQEQQQQRQPLKASTVVQDILQRVDAGGIKRTRFCQRIIPADATCLLSAASLRAALTAVVEQYLAQHWIHSSSDVQQTPLPFAVMFKHRGRSSSSSIEQALLCQQPQAPAAATSPTQDILPASVGTELQPQPQQRQGLLSLMSDNGVGLDSKPVSQHATAEEGLAAKHPTDPAVDRKMAIDIAAEVVQECCKPYGGAKANLTNPQVVIVLEVIPVARQQLACAVAAVPGSLMICKPKLNLRPVGCAK